MTMELSDMPDGLVRVTLAGRLDSPGVDLIETKFLGALTPTGKHAAVDLSKVDFIASMGIRMLISTARALGRRGGRFVLFAPQEGVREIFGHVSLADIIPIYDTEDEALLALRSS